MFDPDAWEDDADAALDRVARITLWAVVAIAAAVVGALVVVGWMAL